MKRKLTLRTERLANLTTDELHDVVGAQNTPVCMTDTVVCRVSDLAKSLCGCLTGYCSVDVC